MEYVVKNKVIAKIIMPVWPVNTKIYNQPFLLKVDGKQELCSVTIFKT